jgi:cytosine/adenosine deaminase-related metal-dependent hydrolase
MRNGDMVVRNAYLASRDDVLDIAVSDGTITAVGPGVEPETDGGGIRELDAAGNLVFPGFVDAHVHFDQALSAMGERVPRHNEEPFDKDRNIARTVEYFEETAAETLTDNAVECARMAVANGVLHARVHTYVDRTVGTKVVEALLEARERVSDVFDMEVVAFPQRGLLDGPAVRRAVRESLELGADLLGGIDPASVNADVERTLETWFEVATEHDVDIDAHVHDAGTLGTFTLERFAEHAVQHGYEGRITASHAFALADAAVRSADPRARGDPLASVLDALKRADVGLTTSYPSTRPGMPIGRLQDRGIAVGQGSDELRDLWVPHGNADPTEGALVQSLRLDRSYTYSTNPGLARLWDLLTHGAADLLGIEGYGLEPGTPADFVITNAKSPQWAILEQADAEYVVRRGEVVAEDGRLVD